MAPPKAKSRQCIKCHILGKITGHEMCKKCWSYEYIRKPEVKERRRLYDQRPESKERRRLYGQRRSQLAEVKEYERVRHRAQRMRAKVAECAGCKQNKKMCHLGLCRNCYDHHRYGSKENCDRIRREQTKKYRSTPRGKTMVKAYNASESTITRKREHRRGRKKDPEIAERYWQYNRRWWESQTEEYRRANRQRFRRWWFFHAGKPVGPFDPNEMRNSSLLRGVKEVREGNLEPQ